jgi:hypothetical protein
MQVFNLCRAATHPLPAGAHLAATLACTAMLAGCSGGSEPPPADPHGHTTGTAAQAAAPPTNRIAVPEAVRRNLGISYVKVESRRVASTLRLPGQFEALPAARRDYRTALTGKVELLVRQYDRVETGTVLFTVDSPDWQKHKLELADAETAVQTTSASLQTAGAVKGSMAVAARLIAQRLLANERHRESQEKALKVAEDREQVLSRVEAAVGGNATELAEERARMAFARAAIAQANEEHSELELQLLKAETESGSALGTTETLLANLAARHAEHEGARLRLQLARDTAASLLDMPVEEILKPVRQGDESVPMWQSILKVPVRASAESVVQTEAMTSGDWVSPGELVLTTIAPERVRFRATAMQGDMGRLGDDQRALIVPPQGGSLNLQDSIPATVRIGLEADHLDRTIEVVLMPEASAPWARAGVSGFAEIVLDDTEEAAPAVPASSVIQDGLNHVVFRRDPADPDQVIRLDADIGVSDGRWIALESGVKPGDEVVLDGVYELMLTGSGSMQPGGHFDPDGTFHTGKH